MPLAEHLTQLYFLRDVMPESSSEGTSLENASGVSRAGFIFHKGVKDAMLKALCYLSPFGMLHFLS